jgi:hypothetical protein
MCGRWSGLRRPTIWFKRCSTPARLAPGQLNRIYQDLQAEVAFGGSYQSVKRYVGKLRQADPQLVCRIEVQPAEEVQVDFGAGPMLVGADGKKAKTWIFRMVLSHSRKGYVLYVTRRAARQRLQGMDQACSVPSDIFRGPLQRSPFRPRANNEAPGATEMGSVNFTARLATAPPGARGSEESVV